MSSASQQQIELGLTFLTGRDSMGYFSCAFLSVLAFSFNLHSESNTETVPLTSEIVNATSEKIGPNCFDLLRVLGKGGYGKVSKSVTVVQWQAVAAFSAGAGVPGEEEDWERHGRDLCNESFEEGWNWLEPYNL